MSSTRSDRQFSSPRLAPCTIAALAAFALAGCKLQYDTDPNANAPPSVVGVVMRDSQDIDQTADLSGSTAANEATPSGENAAFYRFFQKQPTLIAGPIQVYPSQFPEIVFNKLMDPSTMETLQTSQATGGQPESFCEPAAPAAIVMDNGGPPFSLLRTCYNPATELVTVQPASAVNAPPQIPTDIPFLNYRGTYTVKTTSALRDAEGNVMPTFSMTMNVGPFALFSVTNVGRTGSQPSAPSVTTYLYGVDPVLSDPPPAGQGLTNTLPLNLPATPLVGLRMVFTGPVAPPTNMDGTVPTVMYPPGLAIYQADANFNPGPAIGATFTTSDGQPDDMPGTTDPRILFAYPTGGTFAPGNYVLSIPLSFTDNGMVMGTADHPVYVPLSANKDYPNGADALQIPFTVPSPSADGGMP